MILYAPGEAIKLSEFRRRGLHPWDSIPVLYVLGRYTVDQTSAPIERWQNRTVSIVRDVLIDLGYPPATANELRAPE